MEPVYWYIRWQEHTTQQWELEVVKQSVLVGKFKQHSTAFQVAFVVDRLTTSSELKCLRAIVCPSWTRAHSWGWVVTVPCLFPISRRCPRVRCSKGHTDGCDFEVFDRTRFELKQTLIQCFLVQRQWGTEGGKTPALLEAIVTARKGESNSSVLLAFDMFYMQSGRCFYSTFERFHHSPFGMWNFCCRPIRTRPKTDGCLVRFLRRKNDHNEISASGHPGVARWHWINVVAVLLIFHSPCPLLSSSPE